MKKLSVILSSFLLIVILSTFNPNNFNFSFNFFKIKKIEIKNLKILDEKEIKNLFYNKLYDSSLFILDKKKINDILNNNKLIESVELKKIYPSKLQIIIYEKETIAIINFKQSKSYLTKKGEEIKFFQNSMLEKLPNIFGKQKNFLEIYSALNQIGFPISDIKSFYHFDIGRWDIILNNNKIIKLPVKNFNISLKNYMELNKKTNFEKYSTFDYRIKNQLILN
tara:strand:+ start:1807 stop:2475 length:669 start_codon:yes stop_codon:yes gene_type:complete